LVQALNVASSLDVFSERGRVVPEYDHYEVTAGEVQILAFIHGARDLTRLQLDG
jgi:hypothetical protein